MLALPNQPLPVVSEFLRTRLRVAKVHNEAGGLADRVKRQHRLVRKEEACDVERLEGQLCQLLAVVLQ